MQRSYWIEVIEEVCVCSCGSEGNIQVHRQQKQFDSH